MIERTFVLVKADGVQRCIVGEIISRFEKAGLKIVGMKMVWVDKNFAKEHYSEHVDKPFYPGLESLITMGPVVAMVIEGVESVAQVRKMVGATEPKQAVPGTIRGDYAHVSYGHADKRGIAIKNIVHASDAVATAKKEIGLWFKEEEMHTYKTVHDMHVTE